MILFLQCIFNGLVMGSCYTLVALGLTLIFGVLRIPNFGHGNLLMLGAFSTLFLVQLAKISYIGAIFLTALIITSVGVLSYYFLFRPIKGTSPLNLLIIAIGLYFILEAIAIFLTKGQTLWGSIPIPWSGNLNFFGIIIGIQQLIILILTPLLIGLVYLLIFYTRIGSAIRAIAQDPLAAVLMGIREDRVMITTFALASALAGIGGSMVGGIPGQAITPTMASMLTAKAFIIVILGGLGSMMGAIVGGYLIGLAENLGAGLFQGYLPILGKGYADAYAFILLLILVIIKPEGLFSEKRN
ncbi:MAG: branched-chain amino acid ABC transporter permease [Candidatus Anstonellales archaeon]